MEAVATNDVIAAHAMMLPALGEFHRRLRAADVAQRHVLRLIVAAQPSALACLHQVEGDLGLPIDSHAAPTCALQVDAFAAAVHDQFEPAVAQPFALQACVDAGVLQQRHAALLQHAGANA